MRSRGGDLGCRAQEGRGRVPRPVAGPGGNCHLRLPLSLWAQRLLRARWLRWRWLKRAAKGEPAAESGYRRSRDHHQPLGARASASGGATGPQTTLDRATPSLPPPRQSSPVGDETTPCLRSPHVVSCGPCTACFSQQQRSDRFLPTYALPCAFLYAEDQPTFSPKACEIGHELARGLSRAGGRCASPHLLPILWDSAHLPPGPGG